LWLDLIPENGEILATQQNELPTDIYPLKMSLIRDEQRKDPSIHKALKENPDYILKEVRGGSNKLLKIVFCKDKIVVPQALRKRLMEWYHTTLMHPGINRTEATIKIHFTWPKLHDDVEKLCKSCKICQLTKKMKIKYEKLPPKEAEVTPWDTLYRSDRALHY